MVDKPLIRPYSWGGVALGGVARIPLKIWEIYRDLSERFGNSTGKKHIAPKKLNEEIPKIMVWKR